MPRDCNPDDAGEKASRPAGGAAPFMSLADPGLEPVVELVEIVRPEGRVDLQRVLEILRRGRQVRKNFRADLLDRRLARRRIWNEVREFPDPIRLRGGADEFLRRLLVLRAGWNAPPFVIVELAIPDNLKWLALVRHGVIDAAVISLRHDHRAVGEELRRLRAGFPPDDVVLDRVELGESAIHAFRRAQRLVDLLGGNA